MRFSFNPLGPLLSLLTQLRNWLYDRGILHSIRLSQPVISVGNITMGGTGKTPFIDWIVKELKNKGYGPAIVSRSYGGTLTNPEWVRADEKEDSIYGDEPLLLKSKNPDVPLMAGPSKWKSAKKALQENKQVNVLLIDDGYQHRALFRDLDIVLLDASVSMTDYCWPPIGRAREPLSHLRRAEVIVFTKWEQRREETVEYLRNQIKKINGYKPIELFAEQELGHFYSPFNRLSSDAIKSLLAEGRGFAFCGLGNPQSFIQSLKKSQLKIKDFHFFSDHAKYDSALLEDLERRALGADYFITTEKDAIKFESWKEGIPPLIIAPLKLVISGDCEAFNEKLVGTIRKNS